MTGFGRYSLDSGGTRVTAEARSLNQKGLFVGVRVPREFAALEERIRDAVRARFSRGRIDIAMRVETQAAGGWVVLPDAAAARGLLDSLRRLAADVGLAFDPTLQTLLSLPGVMREPAPQEEPPSAPLAMECVEGCLAALAASRASEGAQISDILKARLERISGLSSPLMASQRERLSKRFERTRERIRQLLEGSTLDEQRVVQELAILAERMDVSEEYERLGSHVATAMGLLGSDSADAGRKLAFIFQEIQRELNTMGSKLEDASDVMTVVEMKNELASMKEQVANLE
jgi:uncharacterized protein (TIGR00255 family)